MQRLKEYAPAFAGILLIALGLWVPLGFQGSPNLLQLISALAANAFESTL